MAFKTKAESMFEKKMELALAERNFMRVERLFNQFGSYLELVDGSIDMTLSDVRARFDQTSDLMVAN